ncbi:putative serine/threonine-protein kinase [Ipomoea triloba]|uniref:putative serine/threonine-protein kinase n=1 Tax=Ipomoea triloba TaxID=35885 RepID=UPI00125D5AE2|nr:putative serine/threonine-protein kinase [Ipomoea triloba]
MGFSCFGAFESSKDRREILSQELVTNNVRLFSYNSIRSATGHFHPSNKIGGGGFGVVYKGVLRDGTCVAIKCLSAESKQGTKEFLTEINMISNIRHPNLVHLIGCCVEGSNRMLVYEYLENNSLASALLGSKGKRIYLDWPERAAICLGTASGLAFLHQEAEPHIVHRDIKASNLLLDENLHPKIGDFGLAKLFPDNVTHLSTRVAGTIGYLAPEYALLGQLTTKVDVYSFGVLLLEIISGRSSSKAAFGEDMLMLVEWTWKLKEEGRLLEIVDPELTEYPEPEAMRFIKVALFCTQTSSQQRPSMKQVIEMLSKDVNLNEKLLTEPGVYRPQSSKKAAAYASPKRGKQSVNHFALANQMHSFQSMTDMLPR